MPSPAAPEEKGLVLAKSLATGRPTMREKAKFEPPEAEAAAFANVASAPVFAPTKARRRLKMPKWLIAIVVLILIAVLAFAALQVTAVSELVDQLTAAAVSEIRQVILPPAAFKR
jgi:hypothetical protein